MVRIVARLSLALLCVASSALTAFAGPAQAYQSVCGQPSNWFHGYIQFAETSQPFAINGTSANVTVRGAPVCDTDSSPRNNFTNNWVMITDRDGFRNYAQAGFERGFGTDLQHFAQQSSATTLQTSYYSRAVAGITYRYWNQQTSAGLRSNVNDIILLQGQTSLSTWRRPFLPQYLAEVRYRESDVPGRDNARTAYRNLSVQRASTGGYELQPCNLSFITNDANDWRQQAYNCTAFDSWSVN